MGSGSVGSGSVGAASVGAGVGTGVGAGRREPESGRASAAGVGDAFGRTSIVTVATPTS